jgi:hypothetical protein
MMFLFTWNLSIFLATIEGRKSNVIQMIKMGLSIKAIRSCCALFALCFFSQGCQRSMSPFPQGRYKFSSDPLSQVYEGHLINIKGKKFDSSQVGNKHLDPEMISAIEAVNIDLSEPERLSVEHRKIFKASHLNTITIASAARSPWHQSRLGASYKANMLSSMHLLGLAVDLEMKGKPFDVKRRGDDPQVQECYRALSELLIKHGLVFSEPVDKDPNHVELLKYSRKTQHPSFDLEAWKRKNREVLQRLYREAKSWESYGGKKNARYWANFAEKVNGELIALGLPHADIL